jgi:hypothetical protein
VQTKRAFDRIGTKEANGCLDSHERGEKVECRGFAEDRQRGAELGPLAAAQNSKTRAV